MSEASTSTKRTNEWDQNKWHRALLEQEFWMDEKPMFYLDNYQFRVHPDYAFTAEHGVWRVAVECKEDIYSHSLSQAIGQALLYEERCEHAVACFPDCLFKFLPKTWKTAADKAGIHYIDRSGLADLVRRLAPECERNVGQRKFKSPHYAQFFADEIRLQSWTPEFTPIPRRWYQ